jgi:hypothetical protein
VRQDYRALYAVARRNSKVNARQFRRFCREIGASLEPVEAGLRQLFDPNLIEEVFLAREYVFDAIELARLAQKEMVDCGVEVAIETEASAVRRSDRGLLDVDLSSRSGSTTSVSGRYVFNCTYSRLNQLAGDFPGTTTRLVHEITELALMRMPASLQDSCITVMDGPFFSIVPFPSRQLHTLSHVRYTPHSRSEDAAGIDPHVRLASDPKESRADRMLRDAVRYVPALADAQYVDSLFEVKTVLAKNEGDDGRPILLERHDGLPGAYSILGGKIDNIYEVIEQLEGACLA